MIHLAALAIAVTSVGFTQAPAGDDHPVSYDRTGINWQIPFTTAREMAREQGRLLAIKPVAFGTTPDGCW